MLLLGELCKLRLFQHSSNSPGYKAYICTCVHVSELLALGFRPILHCPCLPSLSCQLSWADICYRSSLTKSLQMPVLCKCQKRHFLAQSKNPSPFPLTTPKGFLYIKKKDWKIVISIRWRFFNGFSFYLFIFCHLFISWWNKGLKVSLSVGFSFFALYIFWHYMQF